VSHKSAPRVSRWMSDKVYAGRSSLSLFIARHSESASALAEAPSLPGFGPLGLPAPQAFDFGQLFAEMVIAETSVTSAGQMQDAGADPIREAAWAGPAAALAHARSPLYAG
jgi:hypothetical protein